MNFFIAVTNNEWFNYLSEIQPDEVNFWRPKSTRQFRAINPGEPFLFKLHAPYNKIVGGGFYVKHTVIPASLAWKAFENKNGSPDFISFRNKIINIGNRKEIDPFIGCTILAQPFFFPKDEWIPAPKNWSKSIMIGKTYNAETNIGKRIWHKVKERLENKKVQINETRQRYGKEFLTQGRLGQGAFRILITDTYGRQCSMTGEKTLPVLEASHIKPYSEGGPNSINNGLLLRSDLHILFDMKYLTVTSDYHIEVSKRIKEEFNNGKQYYKLHGNKMFTIPKTVDERPSKEYIEWHNDHFET